jgi:hypothetical protein
MGAIAVAITLTSILGKPTQSIVSPGAITIFSTLKIKPVEKFPAHEQRYDQDVVKKELVVLTNAKIATGQYKDCR